MNSENISKLLKERARRIADGQGEGRRIAGIALLIIAAIFMMMDLSAGAEYWYIWVIGYVVGGVLLFTANRSEIPDNALLLFAYGEMLDRMERLEETPVQSPAEEKREKIHKWRCDYCGKMTSVVPCEHCGQGQSPYRCGKCGHEGPYDGPCPECGSLIKFIR